MIYVISDLHGYPMNKFTALLKKAGFSDNDFLYIIGDIIDRNGDGGVSMMLWLIEQPNVQLILGNHEAMLLSCDFLFDEITEESINSFDTQKIYLLNTYMYNGGAVTIESLKKLSKDQRISIIDYFRECPLYEALSVNDKDYILVHSGFENFSSDRKLSDYTADELLWTRPDLSDRYFDDITTILGHTPTLYYGEEYRGRILRTDTWIDIDTGTGRGEEAVLLRLDAGMEFRLSKDSSNNENKEKL